LRRLVPSLDASYGSSFGRAWPAFLTYEPFELCRDVVLLEREVQSVLLGWPGPEDTPVGFHDSQVIDAGFAAEHKAVLIELPQLVAVAAVPTTCRVVALVLEADCDPVTIEGTCGVQA
jgi:hypothetical protein